MNSFDNLEEIKPFQEFEKEFSIPEAKAKLSSEHITEIVNCSRIQEIKKSKPINIKYRAIPF
jgi:hypothetical protein